jgi:hypothetical protein
MLASFRHAPLVQTPGAPAVFSMVQPLRAKEFTPACMQQLAPAAIALAAASSAANMPALPGDAVLHGPLRFHNVLGTLLGKALTSHQALAQLAALGGGEAKGASVRTYMVVLTSHVGGGVGDASMDQLLPLLTRAHSAPTAPGFKIVWGGFGPAWAPDTASEPLLPSGVDYTSLLDDNYIPSFFEAVGLLVALRERARGLADLAAVDPTTLQQLANQLAQQQQQQQTASTAGTSSGGAAAGQKSSASAGKS